MAMGMKEVLEQRMEQLGITQYKLTQAVCQLRAEAGVVPPVTRYQSSVRKALLDPQHVTYYVIEDLVKALDGEIIVRWNNRTDVKAS
jgi:hypothetical protein